MTIDVVPTGQAFWGRCPRHKFFRAGRCRDDQGGSVCLVGSPRLSFSRQQLENEDLVRFAEYFGPIGEDPYFAPIEDTTGSRRLGGRRTNLRLSLPKSGIRIGVLQVPPAGTCLYSIDIPAEGGDTFFANQHAAWDAMPDEMRGRMAKLVAVHSAKRAYAKDGRYAEDTYKGSMDIRPSDSALDTQIHPLIRPHPETGRLGVFGGSYVQGFDGVEADAAEELKVELQKVARPSRVRISAQVGKRHAGALGQSLCPAPGDRWL